jgi:zinc transporter, ZIP family
MATATARSRIPGWLGALGPLVLVALLAVGFIALDPIGELREVPAVEEVVVERTVFEDGRIELSIRNDGPDPVTIAQVLVDEAYRNFTIEDATLDRLGTTTIAMDYPWDEGQPISFTLITSTGVTVEHEVDVAAATPEADASTLGIYALLGLYIGLIPVLVGLLWFPALRRASRRWLGFFLAFTIGLLAFLLVDTIAEGFELAAETAGSLGGISLFAIGAIGTVLVLLALQSVLEKRSSGGRAAALGLAYLVAAGIGLHNMGEGLAVGAALAAGEIGLGTSLVLGFALHNTTEGLAIVAPLGAEKERPALWHFALLGAVAGLPTVLGAWAGGFAFSPAWATLAFGVAAGAIAQVVWAIGRSMMGDRASGLTSPLGAAGLLAGLLVMYVTGLFAV